MSYSNDRAVYFCETPDMGEFKNKLDLFLADSNVLSTLSDSNWVYTTKANYGSVKYLNIPISFDIETSSCYVENEKFATMYIWQFGINGVIILGRTWTQFIHLLDVLVDYYNLNLNRRILCYIHNLGYEFQFMREWITWQEVFSPKKRRPLIALTTSGIEFRCSLLLSNYALANIKLSKYKVEKAVGDLDYDKIRTSATPISDKELGYCINDVRVVMSYIQEKIELEGDISKIPLTNTGNVRRFVRNRVFGVNQSGREGARIRRRYNDLMSNLRIRSKDEYDQLRRAFAGGFTHGAVQYSREVLEEEKVGTIGSMDLASSYPFVCVAEYFPMSGIIEEYDAMESFEYFQKLLKKYCVIFDCKVEGLYPIFEYENMLSASKCKFEGKHTENNGRVITAECLYTTFTELDFDSFLKFYDFESIRVFNVRCYRRGYLPKDLILSILDLYEAKTTLKGVEGREVDYMVSKNMINSCYGMMVTNIIRNEIDYSDEWVERELTEVEAISQLKHYNNDWTRFLFYAWGVYVTAHARHNLFSAILEFGNDFVYADTDSIKGLNFSAHMKWINDYNDRVFVKLIEMCIYYGIDFNKCQPKTIKGVKKLIGVWEIEDSYSKFKTIGAKRYIYEYKESGELGLTCAGVNKKAALKYLLDKNNGSHYACMVDFDWGLYLPPGKGGKMSVTYIDKQDSAELVDYLGVPYNCYEKSFVHMEQGSYYLSLTKEYIDYIKGVREVSL